MTSSAPSRVATRRAVTFVVAALLAVVLGCRGGTEPTADTIEQVHFDSSMHVDLTTFTRLPSGVYVRDTLPGTGPAAANGDTLTLRYMGRFPSATQFASQASGATIVMQLGEGRFIPGWELGLVGMKAGGHRQLIVPPELGYGAGGTAGVPPNAILFFDIDLVSLR